MPTLQTLETPCLLLDEARMSANLARLRERLRGTNVAFRPHLKTVKSLDVARRVLPTPHGPATVSTLREAEVLAAAGVTDLLYAVGIAPSKLARVLALRAQGIDLALLLDSPAQARAVAAAGTAADPVPVLLEIDCDGHRAGLQPGDAAALLAVARQLAPGGVVRGVLTHAGGSYAARGAAALAAAARQEHAAVRQAAATLRAAGFPCPVVSVGSTPTAFFAPGFEGITELRAGVYVFFDLVQAGLGVCAFEDIALSVLTTVIGHQADKGWAVVDAGWMALSRDRGTASQAVDQGYGVVCDLAGRPLGELLVTEANQEHGIVAQRPGASAGGLPPLPVGTRLRILPNHACATAAQHHGYHVLATGTDAAVTAFWPRFGGW